jgi:cell division initiation protein
MIDLTPLDVRKKRGDFSKSLRGYEPREVDHFLEMVADRLEAVVKENLAFRDQVERLQEKVQGQEGRESAVQNALVTAQELRKEIEDQAQREAELIRREARMEAEGIRSEAAAAADHLRRELLELNRTRERFLRSVRTMLERQLEALEVEEGAPRVKGFDLDALREAVAEEDVRARRSPTPAPDPGGAPLDAGEGGEAANTFEPAPDDGDASGDEGPTPLDSLLGEGAQKGPGEGLTEEDDLFSPAAEPGDSGGLEPGGGAPRTGEGR